ncbi:hypothetical protein [Psychroserpens sp.]|uniref:hypothetical protein n=1 Tax=Psychroserpens sp. TaxID=2020870 RepID=UPI001B2A3DE7|nr:hypothetical protein [Psychroserpens sp.]MBO6605985.1 hypothetical protein [Psychroserpens sp.]MBO6631746.1 hypothetical protein [Psychroserpens sp.]MBO6652644.1 hypothetical protein [Psychroserpens sp.]MBO6681584.1 hypothetical protein [Psychroserpens sp.]MBO6749359.1 hypothetical protein [Psychroserpens sp.]
MNAQDFTYLLQNPQHLTEEQTNALQDLTIAFPYVQSARALYLKGLKNKGSFKYNHELKTTAAYTTDRSILFDYITSEIFNQNEISEAIKQNSEHLKNIAVNDIDDISVNKSVTIDDALKEHIKNTEGVLDPDLFQQKVKPDEVAHFLSLRETTPEQVILDIDAKHIEETPEQILQIGKPLEFDKTETHSFTEWLKITSFKPIDRSQPEPELDSNKEVKDEPKESSRAEKFNLIDKFLESNPKIVPTKDAPKIRIEPEDKVAHDGLMTETLARIYLEQHNYEKAIQSYKILSLKYPEKSGFFADQIKAIKELQENNTKN